MVDFIVVIILLVVFGTSITYMVKAKKAGVRCIGCPDAKGCGGHCNSCLGECGSEDSVV